MLIEQQEEQARLLEALNQRKSEELLKLQERLEGALGMLHEGQVAYATQQRVLDAQQRQIEQLRGRLQAANTAEAACEMNATQAAAGWQAAKAAAAAAAAAATADCTDGPSGVGDYSGKAEDEGADNDDEEEAEEEEEEDEEEEEEEQDAAADEEGEGGEMTEEEQALMERLRALEAEKLQFEAQLREEQSQVANQLSELQGMMGALGLSSADLAGLGLGSLAEGLAEGLAGLGGGGPATTNGGARGGERRAA